MGDVTTLATREILWNIPHIFKILMYLLFFTSLAIMLKGIYGKILFITKGEGIKGLAKLIPKEPNIFKFLHTVFFTGKVPRFKNVAIFHGLIFYGFLILWITTDVVAIHADTPLRPFQGTTYIVLSFLSDIAGIMVLLGLALAYKRRYVDRPVYLSATKPKQELYMYSMLVALVVLGYLIEGLRIVGNNFPINEAHWSPVGWSVAVVLSKIGLSDTSVAYTHRTLWFLHMVNTMVFIASLGYSKFSHILTLPFAALVTPARRGAVLEPMNFENENAETFGLGKLSELTMKHNLDLLSCVECGRCTQVCPANLAGKPLDPKLIITKTRDLASATAAKGEKDADIWGETPLFTANELDACTTCGACMEECPANIEHVNLIMEAKRYKALTLGDIPPAAADAINKIKNQGNPWGIAQHDRFKWADGLNIPVIEVGKKVDYLYYVGCAGSYDGSNQKVVKDTIALMKKAGVSFAVMGKTEKCNGDPVRRFGDEYSFNEIAIENIANMNQYDFGKVVTHCPHCLHTIGKEYAKFEEGVFETLHHTELLADLIDKGKLVPEKRIDETLTFHDPCYLGRHHGQYNAPRAILNSIQGIKIKEMVRSKDKALCCGMGGGNMWYELPEGEHVANNRLRDIGEKEVNKLATACSYCMINFNSSKAGVKETENLEVEDIASILAKSVL
ncbi:MAG: heterodisulfide reductase-related iron-sulfur binding cluster [Bacteriovorax sp.]|nr:heterodisulfide reductase-related iron-sulfur binding cluster [Bacteriovorax sp.]